MGVGGIEASINGQPIGPNAIGVWSWLNGSVAAGQVCDALGCRLCDNSAPVLPTLDNRGFDFIAAGGSRWATYLSADGMLHDSVLGTVPDLYPLAMSDEGDLATVYYSTGSQIEVTNAEGIVIARFGSVTLDQLGFAFIRSGLLTFSQEGTGWRLVFIDGSGPVNFFRRTDGVSQFVPVWIDNVLWVLETNATNTLTLRQAQDVTAYVLQTNPLGQQFNIDARQLLGGLVTVVMSTTIAENPQDLVRHDLTLAEILALPTIDTSKPVVIPAPVLTVPEHPRAVLRMAYGTPVMPSANSQIPCDGAPYLSQPWAARGIVILPRATDDPSPDRVEQAAQKAMASGYAVGVYDDGPDGIREARNEFERLKARGIAGVLLKQCYPRRGLASELSSFVMFPPLVTTLFVVTCRQFGSTPEELAESHRLVNAAIENGVGGGVLYFDFEHAPSWLRTYIDAYCAATKNPDLSWLPKTVRPTPPVIVTPQPPIVTTDPPILSGQHGHTADTPVVKRKGWRGTLG